MTNKEAFEVPEWMKFDVSVLSDHERERYDRLGRWAPLCYWVRSGLHHIESAQAFPAERGSSIAKDDQLVPGLGMRTAIVYTVTATLHQIDSVIHIVESDGVHAPYGVGSLIRGALEASGAGFWLVAPVSRSERVDHATKWWRENLKKFDGSGLRQLSSANLLTDENDLPFEVGFASPPAEDIGGGLPRPLAAQGQTYTSTEVMRFARDYAQVGDVYTTWMYCSGLAHGRPWASTLGLDMRALKALNAHRNFFPHGDQQDRLLDAAMQAASLTQETLRLCSERCNPVEALAQPLPSEVGWYGVQAPRGFERNYRHSTGGSVR